MFSNNFLQIELMDTNKTLMPQANGEAILIVEDEETQAQVISYNLEKYGYNVYLAKNAQEAFDILAHETLDLVLLDWMLADRSGLDVCRHIKGDKKLQALPVIMLSARGHEDDKVDGLRAGADDYVAKPYSLRELLARISAHLRRQDVNANQPSSRELTKNGSKKSYADITMDGETHRVMRAGQVLKLGPTEYRLLEVFIGHPHKVFRREQLLDKVWASDVHVDERTVDVHVGRLRRLLRQEGLKDLIRTVRSVGYALDEEK